MYISNINSVDIKLKHLVREDVIKSSKLTLSHEEDLIALYVTKGAARYELGQQSGEFSRHHLVLLNPGSTLELSPLRDLTWIKLHLHGALVTSARDIKSKEEVFVIPDDQGNLRQYLLLLESEYLEAAHGVELILERLVDCLFIHVLGHNALSIKDAQAVGDTEDHAYVCQLQDYMAQHYAERLTLDDLATEVGLNKYHLIRLFKQQTGLSPIDYLIRTRLTKAQEFLIQTQWSIAKISDQVGFQSPSHFSKTFKENTQQTPTQYRKNFQTRELMTPKHS